MSADECPFAEFVTDEPPAEFILPDPWGAWEPPADEQRFLEEFDRAFMEAYEQGLSDEYERAFFADPDPYGREIEPSF